MMRLAACALLLAAPAALEAEPGSPLPIPRAALDEPREPSRYAIGDPDSASSRVKKRGVIAGVELAPDAAFGFGVFSAAPKPSLSTSDEKLFGGPRKSRKAGIGLSLAF